MHGRFQCNTGSKHKFWNYLIYSAAVKKASRVSSRSASDESDKSGSTDKVLTIMILYASLDTVSLQHYFPCKSKLPLAGLRRGPPPLQAIPPHLGPFPESLPQVCAPSEKPPILVFRLPLQKIQDPPRNITLIQWSSFPFC